MSAFELPFRKTFSLWAALALAVSAQTTTPDLTDLSLDQLSNIKITSFAKKEQKLSHVAGAVYVITQEQIARSGLTSVPELLRLAPGLDVARVSGSQWSISARGSDGVFANKLLVLIDGRSIYSPVFSGVYWDVGMPMLEDIDRIEVIRGPGATIWGANAVLGVINIITKKTTDSLGTLVTASAGTSERAAGGVRFGGSFGATTYRASFYGADHQQLKLANGFGANDGSSGEQAAFRLDHTDKTDTLMIQGSLFRESASEVGLSPSLITQSFVPAAASLEPRAADVMAEWRRHFGDTAELRFQSYFDYANRPQPQASQVASATWDSELQFDFTAAKRHYFSLGAGQRLIRVNDQTQLSDKFAQSKVTYDNTNAFVQDEIHFLGDRLLATAGVKLEHNALGGRATEPSANLLWLITKHQSLWTSAARAVRTPSLFEDQVQAVISIIPGSSFTGGLPTVVTAVGSSQFGNELVNDFETGYRAELTKRLSLDINLFYDRDSKIRSSVPGSPSLVLARVPYLNYPLIFANGLDAIGKGGETAISWQILNGWKLATSYSYNALRTWLDPNAPLGSQDSSGLKPTHNKYKLQSYWNPTKAVQMDAFAYWTSAADVDSPLPVPVYASPYWRLDVRLGYRINPHWQISLAGQNLLQAKHLEGVPELLNQYSYVTRGAYLKSTWQF